MKKLNIALLALFVAIGISKTHAQDAKNSWIIGVGINIVDDDGSPSSFPDFKKSLNAVPFPSRLNVEKQIRNGFSIEVVGTYNQYKNGKIINNASNFSKRDYIAFDAFVKYDLTGLVGDTKWFDPFAFVGYGLTRVGAGTTSMGKEISAKNSFTHNVGLGFNTWVTNNFGFSFQTMAKLAITGSSHQQHAIGIIYKLGETVKAVN